MNTTIVQTLIEAARTQVLVKIVYKDKERLVEGYSFRNLVSGPAFYGEESGQIKAFTLSRIQSAQATDIKYVPKWPVEL